MKFIPAFLFVWAFCFRAHALEADFASVKCGSPEVEVNFDLRIQQTGEFVVRNFKAVRSGNTTEHTASVLEVEMHSDGLGFLPFSYLATAIETGEQFQLFSVDRAHYFLTLFDVDGNQVGVSTCDITRHKGGFIISN